MTLKEKFRMANMVDNGLTILEKYQGIADDYAIGFAEYFFDNNWNKQAISPSQFKVQLQTYKKEKGL